MTFLSSSAGTPVATVVCGAHQSWANVAHGPGFGPKCSPIGFTTNSLGRALIPAKDAQGLPSPTCAAPPANASPPSTFSAVLGILCSRCVRRGLHPREHPRPCPTKSSSQNRSISSAIQSSIGGIGQGFEATLNWRVHDGHDERTGFFNVGGGTGEHGQFQVWPQSAKPRSSSIGCSWKCSRRARRTARRSTRP